MRGFIVLTAIDVQPGDAVQWIWAADSHREDDARTKRNWLSEIGASSVVDSCRWRDRTTRYSESIAVLRLARRRKSTRRDQIRRCLPDAGQIFQRCWRKKSAAPNENSVREVLAGARYWPETLPAWRASQVAAMLFELQHTRVLLTMQRGKVNLAERR